MTLSHDVTGAGPTVLLLHSTACDRRMWDPQMPVLAGAGYRAVRGDLRGYGDTPIPDRPWNDAEDAVELMDRLGAGQFAVIGASGGGRVALEVAARWPGRVTALALLCTALAGHEPSPGLRAYDEREHALLDAGDIDAAVELNVRTWVGPQADDQARAAVRRMQRRAFEVQLAADDDIEPIRVATELSAITAPALIVAGAHDFGDFRQIAAELAAVLPGARHVELDWAGHLPSLERPELVDPILVDFLATAGGNPAR